MKITIYGLLKLIKENKDLPKKIKYGNGIYVLQENPEDYATWLYDNLDLLNDVILGHFNIEDAIYLEVEILEEEKKIPEKWNDLSFTTMRKREEGIDDDIQKLKGYIETIMRTQNEVIDYLKSKGE